MIDKLPSHWAKYIKETADGCWNWNGCKREGYGRAKLGNRMVTVHRVSYEKCIGPIPNGLELDHLCRNRSCCNPEHLEPVTKRINVLRGNGIAAVHSRSLTCPQGHRYDIWAKGGQRRCSACDRESRHRYYLEVLKPKMQAVSL